MNDSCWVVFSLCIECSWTKWKLWSWILSLVKWMFDDLLLPRHTCFLQYLDCVLTLWLNSIKAVSVQTLQCWIVCCDTAGVILCGVSNGRCSESLTLIMISWGFCLSASTQHTLNWCNTTNSIGHNLKHQSSYLIKPCTGSWKDKGNALVDYMVCARLSPTDGAFWAMRACRQRLHTIESVGWKN